MIPHYGDFPASHAAVCMPWHSFAAATGASSAASNFVAGDVLIYKDGGVTQRTSSAGIVVTTSFDSQTGLQMVTIDLSDNTDAGFYAAAHEYQVGVADVTVDAQTVRFWLGTFSIERAGGIIALIRTLTTYVDTEVASIKTVTDALVSPNTIADALLDRTAGVETGLTPRQALRVIAAATGGKLSGAGTATEVIRNAAADSKDRITATVDASGNRSAITLDLS